VWYFCLPHADGEMIRMANIVQSSQRARHMPRNYVIFLNKIGSHGGTSGTNCKKKLYIPKRNHSLNFN